MRFSVDGWDPGYGTSVQNDAEDLAESHARVDAGVEIPLAQWRPVAPGDIEPPCTVLFVDGVRRIEAQLWIHAPGATDEPAPAICASYAAGVVRTTPTRADVVVAETRRGFFTTAATASDISTRSDLWAATHTAADPARPSAQVLSQALQRKLSELELICAANARSSAATPGDDLLVIDGPLRGRTALPRTVALIKSHHVAYLPPDLNRLVGSLSPGQRTPLFLLGTTWDRFTWYFRLPGGAGSPWVGVVRLECSADLPAQEAVEVANLSQVSLPRFASEPFKEARAPQNLYPVSGLERELRHRLGDSGLLRRELQVAAARSVGASSGTRETAAPQQDMSDDGSSGRLHT